MKDGFQVIDCELHLMEPWGLWEERLEEPYRSRTKIVPPPVGHPPGSPAQRVEFDGKVMSSITGAPLPYRQGMRKFPTVPQMARAALECTPSLYLEGLDIE